MTNLLKHRLSCARLSATLLLCAATLAMSGTRADTPSSIRLAVFDFELEDFSASAESSGESPDDKAQLAIATSEARRLLVQSGRYRLVDIGSSDAGPVKTHSLRSCGCDGAIALQLGADQSLVGVITRISRTEYTVQVQIRDARTGSVVFKKRSDLRMGANYSWSRGASSLIRNDLLAATD
jgi:Protein of unknown function (DUF2380)